VTYRSREQYAVFVLAAVLGVAIMVSGATGPSPATALVMLPFVALALRCLMTRVEVRGDRLRIVNVLRAHELPLADVARFRMGSKGTFSRIAVAELRDGGRIAMFAIQGPNARTRPGNRSAERLVEALNRHLA
jgi:hypothetical protein